MSGMRKLVSLGSYPGPLPPLCEAGWAYRVEVADFVSVYDYALIFWSIEGPSGWFSSCFSAFLLRLEGSADRKLT